jgi:capsular polysaccharide transport system permease protein
MAAMSEAPPTLSTLELKPTASIGDLLAREDALLRAEPPLPWYRRHALVLALFVLPMMIATLYYGLIAADQYASEARFVVRSLSSGGGIASLGLGASGSNNTPMVASNQGLGRATSDDTYSVNEYIRSRDAVDRLERDDDLRAILARPEGDFINRYPNLWTRNNKETLYRHYRKLVDVEVQSDSGISVLEVRAFQPEDAQALARALLAHAEELVNKLNLRAREDAVKFASEVVQKAEDRITRNGEPHQCGGIAGKGHARKAHRDGAR